MDLFHMQEEAPGCIFWHPKGWIVYNALKEYVKKRIQHDGYVEVGIYKFSRMEFQIPHTNFNTATMSAMQHSLKSYIFA